MVLIKKEFVSAIEYVSMFLLKLTFHCNHVVMLDLIGSQDLKCTLCCIDCIWCIDCRSLTVLKTNLTCLAMCFR